MKKDKELELTTELKGMDIFGEPIKNPESKEVGRATKMDLFESGRNYLDDLNTTTTNLTVRILLKEGNVSRELAKSVLAKYCLDNGLKNADDLVTCDNYCIGRRNATCEDYVIVNSIIKEVIIQSLKVDKMLDLIGYNGEFEELVTPFVETEIRILLSRIARKIDRDYISLGDRLAGVESLGLFKNYSVKVLLDNSDEVISKAGIDKQTLIKALTYVRLIQPTERNVERYASRIYRDALINLLNKKEANLDKFTYLNDNEFLDKDKCIQKIKLLLLNTK